MSLPIDLQNGEKVIKVVRRHPVFFFTKLGIAAVGGIIPVAVLLVLATSASGLISGLSLAGAGLWAFGWLVYSALLWYRYQNDLWIVTNQRLVDSLKRTPFNHRLASTDLINVEDMSVEKNGVLATMFNFGNLRCQTAGVEDNFILNGIPEPSKMLSVVDSARDEARRELASSGNPQGRGLTN